MADARTASVVVCAFASERCEQTVRCVTSVLAQRPAPVQVIVVVDHNEDLRAKLRESLPAAVDVVVNPGEPGLSSARNTALGLARGEIVAFIDDDAVAHPTWLARLLAAFDDPMVMGAGGHALPAWQDARPGWFPPEFLWVVGCSYVGLPSAGAVRNPLGCNMAFRAAAFERAGLFDPGIGRLGSRPLGCEETEFCVRAARIDPNAAFVMVAGAEIDHDVPAERCRPSYLLRRCYYEGISKALVRMLGDTRSLDTERAYVRRVLPARLVRACRSAFTGPQRLGALGQLAAVIGGLAAAAAGYATGSVEFRLRPPRTSPPGLQAADISPASLRPGEASAMPD